MDCDWRYTSTCSQWGGRCGSGNSSEGYLCFWLTFLLSVRLPWF